MATPLPRKMFTVGEYNTMIEAGVFKEDDRMELITGDIVQMSPIGNKHVACVNRLSNKLMAQLGESVIVSTQNPICADEYSEPQPDVVLLKPRDDFYEDELPSARDVLLIIEVADTTVLYDRNVKLPLYARAEIPVALLVNLPRASIEVHTGPKNGKYRKVRYLKRGEVLRVKGLPKLSLKVEDIIG